MKDGSALIATSMDGYLTVISFSADELGEPLAREEVPDVVKKLHSPIYETDSGVEHDEIEAAKSDVINTPMIKKKEAALPAKVPIKSFSIIEGGGFKGNGAGTISTGAHKTLTLIHSRRPQNYK